MAKHGDPIAQLGSILHFNLEWHQKSAMQAIRQAADQGHPHAQFQLGVCYSLGIGVPCDLKEGLRCYTKATEQGSLIGSHWQAAEQGSLIL